MNIALFLQMAAEACPDRHALTHNDRHYSYAELYAAANHAAQLFAAANVKFVSLLDVSSPAVPVALMGHRTVAIFLFSVHWMVQRR